MKRFWLTLSIILLLAVPAYSADIRTGGGHILQDEGSSLAARPYLDLTGDGISCSNVDATTTECNVGQAAIPAANYYVAGGNADGELINYSSGWSSTLDFYPNIDTFTNPDFETDVTGWTCNSCGVAPNRSAFAVTGSYSMMFDGNSGGATIVQDAITVMAETPYTITAWVYDSDATNTIDLRIRTDSYTAGSNLCSASTTAAFAGGWYRLSCSTSATNTDTSLYVQVVTNEDLTDIYVDDFQLTIQDRTPSTVVLQDDGFVTCKNSNCAAFDGGIVNINTADSASLEPTTGLTLSAWVFPTSEKTGNIAEKGASTQYSLEVLSGTYYDSKIQFKLTNNSGGISVTTTNAYNIYQWHHVVAQISGTAGTGADDTVYFYVDNVLVDTFTGQNYQMPAHATGLYIGGSTALPGFRGYIDDVRVYSAAISAADITTMYDSGNGLACTGSETSIVACWEMNETSGTTVASLPAGFNGTLANATSSNFSGWRNCKLGNCIQFDGVDDYVEIKHTPDMDVTDTFSFSFWLYRGVDTGASESLFSMSDADASAMYRDFAILAYIGNTDKLRILSTNKGQDRSYLDSVTSIAVGQWYHVVMTKSASQFQIYLNNTLDASGVTGPIGAVMSNDYPLLLGAYGNNGTITYGFNGKIDDFQMYSAVLGTTPISTLYNSGTGTACAGTETDLKACWKFDESSGQVAYQVKNQTGLGSDSNNCTSTFTPCKTIQATINKIPQYYAGSTTVHVASNGLYPENPLMNGYNNSGDFTITFRGYNNPTANQFTDVATLSGTSTGSNTANFPKDTLSLLNDTSRDGTASNGTLTNGPTWLDGSPSAECGPGTNMGGCISFSSTAPGDYITMGDVSAMEAIGQLTVMFWVKGLASNSQSFAALVAKGTDSDTVGSWRVQRAGTNQTIRFTVYNGTSNYNYTTTSNVLDDNWHHVAAVYNGSNINVFIDGADDATASTSVTGNIYNSACSVTIGNMDVSADCISGSWSTRGFTGTIDEVGIFNKALSLSEIQTYCGWSGSVCNGYFMPDNSANLIALYHLEDVDIAGTLAADTAEGAFSGHVQIGDLFYVDSGPSLGTWARVQSKQSVTQLALVTRWGTTPTNTSTYQVFPNKYLPKIHAQKGTNGFRVRNSSGIVLDRLYITKADRYDIDVEASQIENIYRSVTDKSGYIGLNIQDISVIGSALYNYGAYNAGEGFRIFKTSTATSVSNNLYRHGLAGIAGYWGSSITTISTNLLDLATYYGFDWEQNVVSYGFTYNRITRNGYGGVVVANNSTLTATAPSTITSNTGNGLHISNFSHFNADFYGGLSYSDFEINSNSVGILAEYDGICLSACSNFTFTSNTTKWKLADSTSSITPNDPTASSCGTTPSVATTSTPTSGSVTIGSGTVTSCTLTFPVTWGAAPFCTASSNNTGYVLGTSTTTTALTITSSATMAGHVIKYDCEL